MYKVEVFKEINAVLGVLNGFFIKEDLNTFGNEVVRSIENTLSPSFTFMLDVTNFKNDWHGKDEETNDKIDEIIHFINLMGLKRFCIIGAGKQIYTARKHEFKERTDNKSTLFFMNLDEAFDYIKRNS